MKHRNAAETAKRKANFAKVHAEIEKHNKKNSTFELEHNKFSAMVTITFLGRLTV